MKIVKLTFNYDWPIFRQTPKNSQIWGNYKFIIDDNLQECDFWVIYSDYNLKPETVKCPKENIIFIPAECYSTSPKFTKRFLNQFGTILTVQRELKHQNIVYTHNANPWFVNRSYEQLLGMTSVKKDKLISVITSNKAFTEGHRKRLDFVMNLKEYFGDKIDLFGRGINDFTDKWDVLADYKYTIAIENDFCEDWVTEKFFDCMLSQTFPFYYGCPNLEEYVNEKSFIRIDINDFQKTIKVIEKAIDSNIYESSKKAISLEKLNALNKHQFFPWIVNVLEKMELKKNKKQITLKLNINNSVNHKIKKKIKHIKNQLTKD
ncbi:glycosyltransferase family 10 domain-containing protein [Hyunsoonleella ulvae]|uniref:glycosyltransferase family 10 domain-containing protein n=1 Tax=Hyunsoonleella ulvae TaxID=2799948 RepID=UPI00193AC04B|nr:glycosyltransferase family 10 [Hyunsoonleella ulvae]